MKTVTMLELRRNAQEIVREAKRGHRMILTYRGKKVMRLEPIIEQAPDMDDPFYFLNSLADLKGEALTNEQMDDVIYEE